MADRGRAETKLSSARLVSIDALRGLAALGVTLFHGLDAARFQFTTAQFASLSAPAFAVLALILSYGYTGVFLFFLISGFCIHLRWAKAKDVNGEPPKVDFIAFWKRRVRRLYPAYLVALASYVAIAIWLGRMPLSWFTVYDTLIHLLMLHNLDNRICYSINGVFWTLAIEEQLYLAYFLLLVLRQRLGWVWTLAICLVCRLGWFAFSVSAQRLFGWEIPVSEGALSNWFVWALGAVSVEAQHGVIKLPRWCYRQSLGSVFLLVAAGLDYFDRGAGQFGHFHHLVWLVNVPLWGLGFFFVINCATQKEKRWEQGQKISSLVKCSAALGVFSYSLYLTHELAIGYPGQAIGHWLGLSGTALATFRWVVLCPLSIVLARAFFTCFERPFLTVLPLNKLRRVTT